MLHLSLDFANTFVRSNGHFELTNMALLVQAHQVQPLNRNVVNRGGELKSPVIACRTDPLSVVGKTVTKNFCDRI